MSQKRIFSAIITFVTVILVVIVLLAGFFGIKPSENDNNYEENEYIYSEIAEPSEKTEAFESTQAEADDDENEYYYASEKESSTTRQTTAATKAEKQYRFRNKDRLNDHFIKHGSEVGAESAAQYEKMASDVINNPNALYKTEKEDGDGVYYIRATGEFVVLSTDGYIRTYYIAGYDYFNRQ